MAEQDRVRVLAHLDLRSEGQSLLLRWLDSTGRLDFRRDADLRGLDHCQVVLAASRQPLGGDEAAALAAHVRGGGGLVLLGATLATWAGQSQLKELFGWAPAEAGPAAELLVRPVPGGALSERLDAEIPLFDHLLSGDPPPPDATALLTAPWQFRDTVVAFSRPAGAGRVVQLGLGGHPRTLADSRFAQLVYRAVRLAAGVAPAPPVGVALFGFGAIGREHGGAVRETEGLQLRSVCDRSPARRDEAAALFGVRTTADADQLLADPAVDLVVVGVPPAMHAEAALQCLAAGKHVVCEKPFALRSEEVDQMRSAALAAGRLLTVYQSRRWDPDFVALRAAVGSGAIGQLFYMESFIGGHSHPCSYWHSHEPVSGGTIYDWGSHYFDWVLRLFDGEVTLVSAVAQKRVWHDVTNADQVRVDLTFADGAQASFLQSDIAAAGKPKWYVLGTEGAVTGEWRLESIKSRAWTGDLIEEPLAPAESPAIVTVHRPAGDGGVHREVLALPQRVANGFYRNVADNVLLGEPLAVTAGEAARNVAVMEAATRSIAAGGRQLEVRI